MIFAGTPQDALRTLLRSESDVAFLRTDVLEGRRWSSSTAIVVSWETPTIALVAAGELRKGDIKVLNQQFHTLPDTGDLFPFVISTRLYPEWAFAANPATVEVDVTPHRKLLEKPVLMAGATGSESRGSSALLDCPRRRVCHQRPISRLATSCGLYGDQFDAGIGCHWFCV